MSLLFYSTLLRLNQNLNLNSLAFDLKKSEFIHPQNSFKILKGFNKIYPNFIYELEFEKLINDPVNESKKLMNYCELQWDNKCLEFYKRKDLISKTASNVQVRNAVYTDSLKKYLPYRKFLDKYGKKYFWFNQK